MTQPAGLPAANGELRALIEEYEEFRYNLPDALLELELPSTRVTYLNRKAQMLLQYAVEDVISGVTGLNFLDAASQEQALRASDGHLDARVRQGLPYERQPEQVLYNFTLIRKDGSSFPAEVQGSYILDGQGMPRGVRYMFRDISERVRADQERARLAALVESSEDAIISRDPDGRVLSWNRGAQKLFGWEADEIVGGPLQVLESPAGPEAMAAQFERENALAPQMFETRIRARDGAERDISVSVFPVLDGRGDRIAIGGIARDIGPRRAAEAERARMEQMLDALAHAQAEFIRTADPARVFGSLLDLTLGLTGSEYGFIGEVFERPGGGRYLKTHAITDISWDDSSRAFYAEHAPEGLEFTNLETLFGAVLRTGEPVFANDPAHDPRRGGLPPGHPPLRAFMGLPIHIGGEFAGMVGVANCPDGYGPEVAGSLRPLIATCGTILEALRGDRRRREVERQLDLALQGGDLVLWEWEIPAGRVSVIDRGGLSAGPEVEDFNLWVERVHPEDRGVLDAAFREYQAGRSGTLEVELRRRGAAGEWAWSLLRGTIVERDEAGRAVRAAGSFLNIEARKRSELERERLEQQMLQSQKLESLGVFAGGIAHDFNNLLTAILGNLYLAREAGTLTAEQSELLGDAEAAADRGADLVRRLLAFSRPEVAARKVTDLDALVAETASLARPLLTSSVTLAVRRSRQDPRALLDATAIEQLLLNLVANARDAMPEGGEITISRQVVMVGPRHRWAPPDLPRGRYHLVAVRDGGVGIPADIAGRIFDPFFTTKDVGRGSGLGLSAALGIARAHGGWLAAESEAGVGTTFRLLLPMLEGEG